MNPGCRVMSLFLVLLALFQALPVAVDAWQAQQWPDTLMEWLYLRYFSILGCRQCGDGNDVR